MRTSIRTCTPRATVPKATTAPSVRAAYLRFCQRILQGSVAGVNMAGGMAVHDDAIPMNAIGFFETHVLTAGVYEGECIEEVSDKVYKKLFLKEGRLVGFILINDFLRAGIYTSLIRNKTPLAEVDFELLKNRPQLLAFSAEERKQMLAQRV